MIFPFPISCLSSLRIAPVFGTPLKFFRTFPGDGQILQNTMCDQELFRSENQNIEKSYSPFAYTKVSNAGSEFLRYLPYVNAIFKHQADKLKAYRFCFLFSRLFSLIFANESVIGRLSDKVKRKNFFLFSSIIYYFLYAPK